MKCLLLDQFEKNSPNQSAKLRMIEQQVEDGIRDVSSLIEKKYKVTIEEELLEVIDLCVANVLGRVYGESYASRMLTGKISPQFEAFMKPYMQEV